MSVISSDVIEVRKYNPSLDKDYIYSTWLMQCKHSYFAKRIKYPIYFKEHQKIIDHLMSKPSVKILIASPKNEADIISGYLAYEQKEEYPVVHFVYVKSIFRKLGIAKLLLKEANININSIRFTHFTYPQIDHRTGKEYENAYTADDLIKKYPDMIYNPYLL